MGVKELVFGESVPHMPWLPDNTVTYHDFPKDKQEYGYFSVRGEREPFVFLRIDSRDGYQQYLIGAAAEGDRGERDSSLSRQERVKDRILSGDHQRVFVLGTDVTATFMHGARYCKPCIICSKQLETVDRTSEHIVEQPSGGTNFTASGHYGSGVFDPMGREHLSVNICDECLTAKGAEGLVTHVKERQKIIDESVHTDWNSELP